MSPRETYLQAFRATEDTKDDSVREAFMALFAANIAEQDLLDRDPHRDAQIALDFWSDFEHWERASPLIDVRNSSEDERYTSVRVLHPDMPFITDSVSSSWPRKPPNDIRISRGAARPVRSSDLPKTVKTPVLRSSITRSSPPAEKSWWRR